MRGIGGGLLRPRVGAYEAGLPAERRGSWSAPRVPVWSRAVFAAPSSPPKSQECRRVRQICGFNAPGWERPPRLRSAERMARGYRQQADGGRHRKRERAAPGNPAYLARNPAWPLLGPRHGSAQRGLRFGADESQRYPVNNPVRALEETNRPAKFPPFSQADRSDPSNACSKCSLYRPRMIFATRARCRFRTGVQSTTLNLPSPDPKA